MRKRLRGEILLVMVLLLGFTGRSVSFVLSYSHTLSCYNLGIDTEHYRNLGQRLAGGAPLSSMPLDQPPGFVVLLSIFFRLFGSGNLLAPKLGFVMMTTCIAVVVWLLGRRLLGTFAGLAAGLAVITSPMLRAYSATLQYEIPTAFFLTVSFGLLFLAVQTTARRYSTLLLALSGLAIALAALTREVMVICFPVMLTWLLIQSGDGAAFAEEQQPSQRQLSGAFFSAGGKLQRNPAPLNDRGKYATASRRRRTTGIVAFALIFFLLLGGWVVYRSVSSGRFVPISTKGSLNFDIGNNPNANGTYNLSATGIASPRGWDFIRERPLAWARLVARKFALFWGMAEDGWNVPRRSAIYLFHLGFGLIPFRVSVWLAQGAGLALLFFAGSLLILKRRSALWLLPASIAGVVTVHLLLISSHRFAVPVLPAIYLVAAAPLGLLAARLRRLSAKSAIAALGITVVWFSAARSYRVPVRLEWRPADYRASGTKVVGDGEGRADSALLVPGGSPPARAVYVPDTFLPRGFAQLSIDFESAANDGADILEARIYTEKHAEITAVRVARLSVQPRGTSVVRLQPSAVCRSFSFYLPEDQVLKTEILGLGREARLSQIRGEFGLSEPPEEQASVLSDGEMQVLDLGGACSGAMSLGEGWGQPETWAGNQTVQWATGDASFIYLWCSDTRDLDLGLRASPFQTPQQVCLLVNQRTVGQADLQSGWSEYRLRIPKQLFRKGLNLVELRHTNPRRPVDLGLNSDTRRLAAAYDWISISAVLASGSHGDAGGHRIG